EPEARWVALKIIEPLLLFGILEVGYLTLVIGVGGHVHHKEGIHGLLALRFRIRIRKVIHRVKAHDRGHAFPAVDAILDAPRHRFDLVNLFGGKVDLDLPAVEVKFYFHCYLFAESSIVDMPSFSASSRSSVAPGLRCQSGSRQM